MADFESDLSGLFQSEVDPSIGAPLATAAMTRIQDQDERRSLAITVAGIIGVAAAASVVGASGAVKAFQLLFTEATASAPHSIPLPALWSIAALALAAGAFQASRSARSF